MTESDRTTLTFRQAEGLEPLPTPLALGEISEEARALIWSTFYRHLNASIHSSSSVVYQPAIGNDWLETLVDWHVRREHRPIDEFQAYPSSVESWLKQIINNWRYDLLFDFLTFVMRHKKGPPIGKYLSQDFRDARLAYFIQDNTIYPAATSQEGATLRTALTDLAQKEYGGARSHITESASLLSVGDWAGSVREAIHAVESVAKVIEPNASTLSDALRKLATSSHMNPNLRRGLEALYNYSSDEAGIRHAKVFEAEANVDQADAAYMLGACASFVSLLIARARTLR